MVDFVEILEGHATALGWKFGYGNAANKNLLQSNSVAGEISLLLDPVTRSHVGSENGGIGETTFTGSFMVLVKSNLDNVYHNQKNKDKTNGKYEKNIKPLLEALSSLKSLIDCSDIEINTGGWVVVDAVNALDANMDGIIVTYSVKTL